MRIQDGIHNNLNEVITKPPNTTLSNNDIEILKYGLKMVLPLDQKNWK